MILGLLTPSSLLNLVKKELVEMEKLVKSRQGLSLLGTRKNRFKSVAEDYKMHHETNLERKINEN